MAIEWRGCAGVGQCQVAYRPCPIPTTHIHHPVHSIASLPDSYHHTPVIQYIVSLLLVSSYTSNPVIQYIIHPDKNAYITNMTSICSLDFTRLLYIHSINQYSTYYLPLSFAYFTSTHRSVRHTFSSVSYN